MKWGLLACSAALAISACASDRCPTATTAAPVDRSTDMIGGAGFVASSPNGFVIAASGVLGQSFGDLAIGGNVFVASLDAAANLGWHTGFGVAAGDFISAIAVDDDGDVYIAGTSSAASIAVGSVTLMNPSSPGTTMLYVARLAAASGVTRWAKVLTAGDVTPISIDARAGEVLVTGTFDSGIVIGKPMQAPASTTASFVAMLSSSDGTPAWADAIFDDAGQARVAGGRIAASGDAVVALVYAGTIGGVTLPTPPFAQSNLERSTLLAVLAKSDGAASADTSIANSPTSHVLANGLVRDGDDFVVFGDYTAPATFGGITANDASGELAYSFDATLAPVALVTIPDAPLGSALAASSSRIVVAGAAPVSEKQTPTLLGHDSGTTAPLAGAAAVIAVVDAHTSSFLRGWDIPPTSGEIVEGVPSFAPTSVALGQDGRILVAAELAGTVNLNRCGVSDTAGLSLVFFSIAP